jgi:hypothetical protein
LDLIFKFSKKITKKGEVKTSPFDSK